MPGALPGSPAVGGDATFPADPTKTAADTPQGLTSIPRARPTPAKTLRSKIAPGCLLFPVRGTQERLRAGHSRSVSRQTRTFSV